MRQGISTRYLGPTNSRGSRIKAIARKRSNLGAEMSHTRSYQYEGSEKEHTLAAKELATKLGWWGFWVGAGKPEEDGYHYVNLGNAVPVQKIHGEDKGGRYGPERSHEDEDWFWIDRPEPVE